MEFTLLFQTDREAEETLRAILAWSALGSNKAKVSFLGKVGLSGAPRAPGFLLNRNDRTLWSQMKTCSNFFFFSIYRITALFERNKQHPDVFS